MIFHKYYVMGFVESGQRHPSCRNREYAALRRGTERSENMNRLTVSMPLR